MKIFNKLLIVLLALFVEIMLLESGIFGRRHGPIADTRYRRKERLDAFYTRADSPSPATEAAFQRELVLMRQHPNWEDFLMLPLFLLLNGVGIYYYVRSGRQPTSA